MFVIQLNSKLVCMKMWIYCSYIYKHTKFDTYLFLFNLSS